MNTEYRFTRAVLAAAVILASAQFAAGQADDIALIRAVGPEGQGHVEAVGAAKRLGKLAPAKLVTVLRAMEGASPLALNWLRVIASDIADNGELPADALTAFVSDPTQNRDARFAGFLLLEGHDRPSAQALLDGMLDDPSLNLRYAAIDKLLSAAKKVDDDSATNLYKTALKTARHPRQLQDIAKALRDAGEKVDLAKRMGFLTEWKLLASFDNTDVKGYETQYAPEIEYLKGAGTGVVSESFDGKDGKVSWQDFTSSDELGLVDLNPIYSNEKSAVCYGITAVDSEYAGPAQMRLGCINANKIWVNGELVMQNEVYHARTNVDQYIDRFQLKKGINTILIKVCQNAQTESWAQRWQFQLRVTDPNAAPIQFSTSGQ